MGTEVLRPQNCLVDRIRNSPAVFQRRRSNHRKPPSRPEQRRRFGSDVVEKMTILSRGESLGSRTKREKSPPVIVAESVYAGSATSVVSPAPSSLPFPSFSRKNKSQVVPVDDSATRDLRRLLRLES